MFDSLIRVVLNGMIIFYLYPRYIGAIPIVVTTSHFVKLSNINNIMIIVFIFTILLFLYFLFAFYLSLCILTGSWIKLFINKKGKK